MRRAPKRGEGPLRDENGLGTTEDATLKYYDRLAPEYEEQRFRSLKDIVTRRLEEALLDEMLSQTSGKLGADIGAGTGRISKLLLRHCENIVLVEPALGMLRILETDALLTTKPRIRSETKHLPFPDRTLDIVTAVRVLWHVEAPLEAIAEIARVLKPGGYAVFDFASARSLTNLAARVRGVEVQTHFLSRRQLMTMLETAGLEAVQIAAHKSLFLQVFPDKIGGTSRFMDALLMIEGLARRAKVPGTTFTIVAARRVHP